MIQIELDDHSLGACAVRLEEAVLNSELAVFPTDTVFGLGGCAFSRKVLDKLMNIKPERSSKPTAVLIDSLIRLSQFGGDVPGPKIVHLAETYWPGPLTLVWRAASSIPAEFLSQDRTLGYRIPNSELLLKVIRKTERPLWATSANLPGRPAPRLFSEVDSSVCEASDLVIKTRTLLSGRASTVVDVRGKLPVVLREGAISEADILHVWKKG
ncbi:MAG: threonylcarbamoyl-AMP synthase [Calditrichaeota bacterium]|nr:threonylcarbamoyl-AMP synthase [Calditrichota bacterium]MCB9366556.1 threonylcarbamoyl-AMP synthase [Calditrichota bacterium]